MRSLDLVFVLSNLAGIIVYLRLASRGWRIPEEHGAIPVAGEPFVWALALPVFGAFILADIAWAILLLRLRQPKRWLWWLIAGGLWVFAIAIDFGHH